MRGEAVGSGHPPVGGIFPFLGFVTHLVVAPTGDFNDKVYNLARRGFDFGDEVGNKVVFIIEIYVWYAEVKKLVLDITNHGIDFLEGLGRNLLPGVGVGNNIVYMTLCCSVDRFRRGVVDVACRAFGIVII